MALQRLGAGLAWLMLVAVSLFLLEPSLFFPDVALPPALDGPLGTAHERRLIGIVSGLVAVAMGLGGMSGFLRSFRRPGSRPLAFAGPWLGAEPGGRATGAGAGAAKVKPPIRVAPSLKLIEPGRRIVPAPIATPVRAPPAAAPVASPLGIVVVPGHKALHKILRSGDAARDAGVKEAALEHYAQAVEIARAAHAVAPEDPAVKADLAVALPRLAAQEEGQGRIETALPLYEETVELRRALAAAAPEDACPSEALATALTDLADCREARGHVSRARDLYAEATAISERLSWLEPQSQQRRVVLTAHTARLDALRAGLKSNED